MGLLTVEGILELVEDGNKHHKSTVKWWIKETQAITLSKILEAVDGVEVPDGTYLWDNLRLFKEGQKAMRQAIKKAIEGEK